MKENKIVKLTDREHIMSKSGMYLGQITECTKELLLLENDAFVYKTVKYVPGFLKIVDEIIDNSVDEAIRTNFQYATNIRITFSNGEFTIEDDGRGVPQSEAHDGIPQAVLAFTEARAGSNFVESTKANGIGTNGVGSFLTNVFSKEFIVTTWDGKNELKLISTNNAETFTYSTKKSGLRGTKVQFKPDIERFGMKSVDEVYFQIIKNRCLHLAQSFPEIKFKLEF